MEQTFFHSLCLFIAPEIREETSAWIICGVCLKRPDVTIENVQIFIK